MKPNKSFLKMVLTVISMQIPGKAGMNRMVLNFLLQIFNCKGLSY